MNDKNSINKKSINEKDLLDAISKIDDEFLDFEEKKNVFPFKKWIALAACIAIVFTVAYPMYINFSKKPSKNGEMYRSEQIRSVADKNDKADKNENALKTFASEKEFNEFIKKNKVRYHSTDYMLEGAVAVDDVNGAMNGADGDIPKGFENTKDVSEESDSLSSSTYVREAGVDEGDIVKIIDNKLFVVKDMLRVEVFTLENGHANHVNSISLLSTEETKKLYHSQNDYSVSEIYLSKNRLVIVSTRFEMLYSTDDVFTNYEGSTADSITMPNKKDDTKTTVSVFDISDIENIRKLETFFRSGTFISSRMIENNLFLVSNKYIVDNCKPYFNKGAKGCELALERISYINDEKCGNYNVISSIDIEKCDYNCEPKAIICDGWDVYCSANNLYIYNEEWGDVLSTNVVKIALDNELSVVASTSFKGITNTNYCFSERDGKLFVAVIMESVDAKSKISETNRLVVLDERLKEIARTNNFGNGESIKAVRYIGDFAYVITYEETDPLFAINISDFKNPKVLGEVKIDGFSTMLVDVGNNRLLGIGYSTSQSERDPSMQKTDGVKFALFDVSNPLEPKVLDSKEYKNLYSDAQFNPKAFVQNLEKGLFAIPYTTEGYKVGAIIVSVENGKIVEKTNYSKKANQDVWRCRIVFCDNFWYLIDNNLNIESFFN